MAGGVACGVLGDLLGGAAGDELAAGGTAFGADHARMLQRLMGNNDAFNGEVVFTFDGDAAGQAAALKVFHLDQAFVAHMRVESVNAGPVTVLLEG